MRIVAAGDCAGKKPACWHNDLPVPAVGAGMRKGEAITAMTMPKFSDIRAFAGLVLRRFFTQRSMEAAASLTFSTLLGLVPLLAIGLALFSAFPAFQEKQVQIEQFVVQNLLPEAGSALEGYFRSFLANTGKLTSMGTIGLAVSALALLGSIEGAFNRIWRVERPRPLVLRLLSAWALLTVGPLLFGLSLTISTWAFAAASDLGGDAVRSLPRLTRLLPPLFEIAGAALLFLVVPNRKVRLSHALLGGVVTMVLFEALKTGFAVYLKFFPVFNTLYGALSLIPILLVWVYASWIIVLLGAQTAASAADWRRAVTAAGVGQARQRPASRLAAACALMAVLDAARRRGEMLEEEEAALRAGIGTDLADDLLDLLEARHYTARTEEGAWVSIRDAGAVSFYDFIRDLGLQALAADLPAQWQTGPLAEALRSIEERAAPVYRQPLSTLLVPADNGNGGDEKPAGTDDIPAGKSGGGEVQIASRRPARTS